MGWLKQRYGSLEALVGAWHHRYTSWEQVAPPRTPGGYPDWYDWLWFRIENMADHMRFRVARLREGLAGADIPIVSHGAGVDLARGLNDTWRLAAEVDEWGFSKKELGPYDRGRAFHEDHLQSADYGPGTPPEASRSGTPRPSPANAYEGSATASFPIQVTSGSITGRP